MEIIAQTLLEKEIIFQSDLVDLIGERPFDKPTTYETYTREAPKENKEETITPKAEETSKEEVVTSETKPEEKNDSIES